MRGKSYVFVSLLALGVAGLLSFILNPQREEVERSKSENVTDKHTVRVQNFNFLKPIESTRPRKEAYWYHVRGVNSNAITKEELTRANAIHDIIPNYPHNWIEHFKSYTVVATKDEKETTMKFEGTQVNAQMRTFFSSITTGTELHVKVDYTSMNSVTEVQDAHELNYWATVVPYQQAEFAYGNDSLVAYLRAQTEEEVREKYHDDLGEISVQFRITKNGEIANVGIQESSRNGAFDAFILEAVKGMPHWVPAANKDGIQVAQDFEFVLTLNGC